MAYDITGPRNTGNISQSIRKVDMKEAVLELEPNAAPLQVLSSRLGTNSTHNPEYSWQEDSRQPRYDAVNGTTGTGSAIVVDNPSYFAEHDLVKNTRTGEVMRVLSVVAATSTVNFVRGVGGSAVAVADNDELLVMGGAQPEGDTSKPARSGNPTKVTNYTQILRTPFESTETLIHSDTFTRPTDFQRSANKAGVEHNVSWEYVIWHGKPSELLTAGANPRRTTGGVFHYVSTNITDAGGAMTEAEFFGAFSAAFRYGNRQTKTAFASRLAVDVVNGFPRGKLETVQSDNDKTYGLAVQRFVSPHGTLNFVTHDLFEGSVYGGYIVILDLSLVKSRPLANQEGSRDTHIKRGIQANDADTLKHEYLTEKGLEFGLEKAHAIIKGITS
jgi:hypothetical protein